MSEAQRYGFNGDSPPPTDLARGELSAPAQAHDHLDRDLEQGGPSWLQIPPAQRPNAPKVAHGHEGLRSAIGALVPLDARSRGGDLDSAGATGMSVRVARGEPADSRMRAKPTTWSRVAAVGLLKSATRGFSLHRPERRVRHRCDRRESVRRRSPVRTCLKTSKASLDPAGSAARVTR